MFFLALLAATPVAALAADAPAAAAAPNPITGLMPLVFVFVIFYFLLIRPQKKRADAHASMVNATKKGDHVITAGGVFGKVAAVEDDALRVEIASGVEIRVVRSTISSVVDKEGKPIQPLPKPAGKNDNVTASGKPVANDN
jgi:preprotein translocase subunit YajC